MTEATTATNPNTANHPAPPIGPPYEIPKFDPPKMEIPAAFRELADKGVAQAKVHCDKFQAAGNEMTAILEETYTTAAKGVAEYNLKLFEIARANTNAVYDFACKFVTLKSPSEIIELSTAHARQQFDRVSAQNKELLALAQKVVIEIGDPIKQSVTKGFNKIV
jgi:phasin